MERKDCKRLKTRGWVKFYSTLVRNILSLSYSFWRSLEVANSRYNETVLVSFWNIRVLNTFFFNLYKIPSNNLLVRLIKVLDVYIFSLIILLNTCRNLLRYLLCICSDSDNRQRVFSNNCVLISRLIVNWMKHCHVRLCGNFRKCLISYTFRRHFN